MQEHFNNRHGGADVAGHDVESLKAKRIRFDSQGTLPQLDFICASKLLLMASYHIAYKVAESKKPHTIVEERDRRDGVAVRASASQSVDLGSNPLVESYQKTLKNGIHSFPAWRSAFRGGCGEQTGKFACCVLGQGT